MTVYSINKQAFDQANLAQASTNKTALTPEEAFTAALQKASVRFGAGAGAGAEVSANSAFKDRFDRPAPAASETRTPDRADRAERRDDHRDAAKPGERTESRADAAPADKVERPAEARRDDQPKAEDTAKADEPAAEGKVETAGETAEPQQQSDAAATDASQPAETQAVAAPVQPQQQQAVTTVTNPDATLLSDDGAEDDALDPFAWLMSDHGDDISDLEGQLVAEGAGGDDVVQDEDPLLALATAAAKAAKAQGTVDTQTQTQQAAKTGKTDGAATELVQQQAEDLAEVLAGTGAAVKVKVSVDTGKAADTATTEAADTGATLLDELLGAEIAAEAPGSQPGAGQSNQSNGQGMATAAQQLARNGAADNVRAAQGRATDAKPFAAVLAAQVDGTTQSQGGPSNSGPQGVAGLNGTTGAQAAQKTTAAQAAQAPHQPRHLEPKQVIDQISVQIAKQAKDGSDTIKVQLKPVDLGRIEIKLEVQDGRVTAHVTADSKDTLSLLQKDSRGLEKALQDAGLKAEEGSMTFSLANDGKQAQQGGETGQRTPRRRSRIAAAAAANASVSSAAEAPRMGRRAGVDIKV